MMHIPERGLTRQEIFSFLNIAKSYDAKWDQGRIYAYIYDPGEDVMEVGKQAFLAYMVENGLDPTTFPSLLKLEGDVTRAVIHLLRGGEQVVGSVTTGGTESILMAVKTARDWARQHRPEIREPEMIVCQTAHHAFHKAAHYFGLKAVVTAFDPHTFRADVEAMRAAITPNTVLLVGSAPAYPQGVVDPIPEIARLAQENGLLCHVDACVGGIHLSMMRKMGRQVPPFDWTVPGVTSISTDLHKFGYCPKQASVVMYASRELRRFQMFTSTRTTGYTLVNPTMLSSRSGGPLAGAWAVLNYLGEDGYMRLISAVMEATQTMMDGVRSIPELRIMGQPEMCLFAITSDTLDMFQLTDAMVARGWTVQSQFGKPGSPRSMHISVQYSAAKHAAAFVEALRESVAEVKQLPPLDTAAIKAQLNAMLQSGDPDLFEKAAAMVGIQGQSLPSGLALISALLEAMPDEVQAQFLIEYFNNLYA